MKIRTLKVVSVVFMAIFLFLSGRTTVHASGTFYATPTDQGTHDCLSLANSCDLQQALDAANVNDDDTTINLAAGTYSINTTFVHVGFAHTLTLVGAGTSSTFITTPDNGISISTGGMTDVSAIDFKENVGLGMYLFGSGSFNIHDSKFEHNDASGMYLEHSSGSATAQISNNIFTDNHTINQGAGMGVSVSSGAGTFPITFSDNLFARDHVSSGNGGGLYILSNADNSPIIMKGNGFVGDTTAQDGGGAYIFTTGNDSGVTFERDDDNNANIFDQNTAGEVGGGLYIVTQGINSDIVVGIDVEDGGNTFTSNTATSVSGGGMYVDTDGDDSSIVVSRNTIESNTADDSGGMKVDTNGAGNVDVTITHNTISENQALTGAAGGGTVYAKATFHFENNTLVGNVAATDAGGIAIQIDGGGGDTSNNYISNNTFIENATTCGSGGGFDITLDAGGSLTMNANSVKGNSANIASCMVAEGGGGRLQVYNTGFQTILTNNLFVNNDAGTQSGGFDYYDESPSWGISMVNNTLVNNSSDADGGNATFGFNDPGGESYFNNNIFWAGTASGSGQDVFFESLNTSNIGLSYNDFGDFCVYDGTVHCNPEDGLFANVAESDNLNANPLFKDIDADYHLKSNSTLVDTGNSSVDYVTDEDLDGRDRIQGSAVDMGAYESIPQSHIRHGGSSRQASLLALPPMPVSPEVPEVPITTPKFIFSRMLKLKMTGEDVKELQKFLNTHHFTVSAVGVGSAGNESSYFGTKTKAAVILFQKAHLPLKPDGIIGPKTIGVITSLQ